jgi:hypothetical protein
MSDELDQALAQAHELIEDGQFEDAREILEPLLDAHPDNPDVWWVYSHAVEDPDEGRRALQNVSRLNPDYPGVQNIALDDDIPVEEREQQNSRRWLPLVAIVVIVLLIVLVFAVLGQSGGDDDDEEPTPTTVVAAATTEAVAMGTEEPTVAAATTEAAVVETEEPTAVTTEALVAETEEPTDAAEVAAASAMSAYELSAEGITISDTPVLGTTLVASICHNPTVPLRDAMESALLELAASVNPDTVEVDALGIRMVNCTSDNVFNLVGAYVDDIIAFNAGTITEAEFIDRWQAAE